MMKNIVIFSATALVMVLGAFKAINAEETSNLEAEKSVAWYVANIKAAKAKNQECHDNPGAQSPDDCAKALHALEISFTGGN